MNGETPPVYVQSARNGDWLMQVWVQPGAKADEASQVQDGRLKVRLRAPAVENKANQALIVFLAKLLGVSKSNLELASGQSSRKKTVRVRPGGQPAWPFRNASPTDLNR